MPNLLKIGMTTRTPEERVKELFTTGVPTPFKIEFAKKVCNPEQKEKTLHRLLEQYTERVSPRREFFRVSTEEVREFFDLMDGEMWEEICEEGGEEGGEDAVPAAATRAVKGCRDMSKCFMDGQRIRHKIGINKIWTATYERLQNVIVHNGVLYKKPSAFAKAHYEIERPDRKTSEANGWAECEYEENGEWKSTFNMTDRSVNV
jgi:hypothetical protein